MKYRSALILYSTFTLLTLCVLASGCNFSQHENLSGSYVIYSQDSTIDSKIASLKPDGSIGRIIVPAYVFAVGFDSDFIIAKRNIRELNSKVIEFYIIRVDDGKIFRGMEEKEFLQRRKELGLPSDLTFTQDTSTYGGAGLK